MLGNSFVIPVKQRSHLCLRQPHTVLSDLNFNTYPFVVSLVYRNLAILFHGVQIFWSKPSVKSYKSQIGRHADTDAPVVVAPVLKSNCRFDSENPEDIV